MSSILRSSPPTLIPNSGTYLWEAQIRRLPDNISWMSIEGQKKFVEALKMTEKTGFRILEGSAREEWFNREWKQIEKTIPKGHYTEKIFALIKTTTTIVIIVLAIMQAYARL